MLKINKMKTIVNILFFLVVINSYSQEYMDKIAEGTCECITKKKIDLKKDEQLKLSLGLCMMESYSKYEHLVPKKERLDLSNTEITDASLTAIGSLASLVRLDLSRTMIRGSELSKLTGLKKLTHLRLANNNLKPGSVAAIASLTGLQHLELMRCGLTDDDLNKLKTLTELKGIELTDNNKLSDRSLEALQGMKKLYWLNLEGTSYTAPAIASRLGNRALRLTFYKGQFSQADKQLLQSRNKFFVLNEVDRKLKADPTVFAPLH